MSDRIERLIQNKIQEVSKQVPGISYFYTDSQNIFRIGNQGYENLEKKIKLSSSSIWNLQSITKNITATTVAWLVSENLTTYDTTINPALGLQFASTYVTDNVTIKNGLSHTTGLPTNTGITASQYFYNLPQIYGTINKYPLFGFCDLKNHTDKKQCEMKYCNTGITIGFNAAVADAGYGKSWKSMIDLQHNFTKRIGMNNVRIGIEQLVNTKHLVQPYTINESGEYILNKLDIFHPLAGADGIFTTITSLSKFVEFHLNKGYVDGKSIVKTKILNELYKPVAISDSDIHGDFYGMGTSIYTFPYKNKILTVFGHGGAYTGGFLHQMLYNPETGIGVAILTNLFGPYALCLSFYIYFILLLGDEEFAEDLYQKLLNESIGFIKAVQCNISPLDFQYNTQYDIKQLPGLYYNQMDGLIKISDNFVIRVGKTKYKKLYFNPDYTWFKLETSIGKNPTVIDPIQSNKKIVGLNLVEKCSTTIYVKL
jgi:CubicO group peptidase (beta-lactamase class C family)